MAAKDIMEKTLESYTDVFADIINVLLFHGERIIQEEELEEKAPRSVYKTDGKIRETERDVVKQWKKDSLCIACIGVENQTTSDPDMPLRVIGYDGAEYRAQLLKEGQKQRYPVVTIGLYFGYDRRWVEAVIRGERLYIPKKLKPYINEYKINLFEIAYLSDEQLSLFESDFWIVADYFVQMRKKRDYQPTVRRIRHVQETLDLLSVLTGDSSFEETYNEREGGIHNMCEVLDRIEKRGREEGIKQGIEQGIEQGILTERERMIRKIYKKGYSVEQISEIVEMPEKAVKLIVGEPVIM